MFNIKQYRKEYYLNHRLKCAKLNYLNNWQRKIIILQIYSKGTMKCALCKEDNIDVLEVDHIKGKGKQHKKKLVEGGLSFYNWLTKNNYPVGFRILCRNCNWKEALKKVRIYRI